MKAHTFGDWWDDHKMMSLFFVRNSFWDIYPWWSPKAWRLGGLIPELVYYLRCRLWTRYNAVVAKTLAPTYSDPRERLLHAAFELLRATIEDEKIFERNAAEGDPGDGKSWAWALREMADLYDWWTVRRPARETAYGERLRAWAELHRRDRDDKGLSPWANIPEPEDTKAAYRALAELDESVTDKEDDDMLRRLITVRQYMWT